MDVFELLQYMVEEEHKQLDDLLSTADGDMLRNKLSLHEGEEDSIGERLGHIISEEYRMATYLYQTEDDREKLEVDTHTVESLKEAADISKARHLETLRNLELADLDKVWISQVSGNRYEYKFLLWHFIEHIATHRGQVAMAINRYLKKSV